MPPFWFLNLYLCSEINIENKKIEARINTWDRTYYMDPSYLSQCEFLRFHPFARKFHHFAFLYSLVISYCVYVLSFPSPFTCWYHFLATVSSLTVYLDVYVLFVILITAILIGVRGNFNIMDFHSLSTNRVEHFSHVCQIFHLYFIS